MATDYIRREAALDFLIPTYDINISSQDSRIIGDRFEEFLKSIPAADVRPVVRGKWKAHGDCGVTECSVCGWSIEECIEFHYCPNCGADMREEETE